MITTEPDLPICDNVPECAVSAIIPWHAMNFGDLHEIEIW